MMIATLMVLTFRVMRMIMSAFSTPKNFGKKVEPHFMVELIP